MTATAASTAAISSLRLLALLRAAIAKPTRDPAEDAEDGRGGEFGSDVAADEVVDRADDRGGRDHERARRGRDPHRNAAPRVERGHLQHAAADPEDRNDARENGHAKRDTRALQAVRDFSAALVVVVAPAEQADVDVGIANHVAHVQAAQEDGRDHGHDAAEHMPERRLRKSVDEQQPDQAAGRREDLEHHAEAQVGELEPAGGRRGDARRRDDGHQADAAGGAERQAEGEVEERHEEHAAADPEQCPEAAGHDAGGQHQGDRDNHAANRTTAGPGPLNRRPFAADRTGASE